MLSLCEGGIFLRLIPVRYEVAGQCLFGLVATLDMVSYQVSQVQDACCEMGDRLSVQCLLCCGRFQVLLNTSHPGFMLCLPLLVPSDHLLVGRGNLGEFLGFHRLILSSLPIAELPFDSHSQLSNSNKCTNRLPLRKR